MSRLVIERALGDYTPGTEYRWDALLNSTPAPAGLPGSNVGPTRVKNVVSNLIDPVDIPWAWNGFQIPSRPAQAAGNGHAAGPPAPASGTDGVPEQQAGHAQATPQTPPQEQTP
jgi:hypothetical protein